MPWRLQKTISLCNEISKVFKEISKVLNKGREIHSFEVASIVLFLGKDERIVREVHVVSEGIQHLRPESMGKFTSDEEMHTN